ncbi:9992_t:CDS:2, partial [Dentiscutata erythropus]
IQKEQNRVQLDITAILRGAPRPSKGRLNEGHELRLRTVLDVRSNRSTKRLQCWAYQSILTWGSPILQGYFSF